MVESSGVTVQGDIYTPNPVSADFSVDGVIASLEGVVSTWVDIGSMP